MDITKIGIFRLLSSKMDWLTQRQGLLSQNVSNAETPGYHPSDLKPFSFGAALQGAQHLAPTLTNPAHMQRASNDTGPFKVEQKVDPANMTASGNDVSLEDQMTKVGETVADYNTITSIYKKQVGLLRMAIGKTS